MAISRDEVVDGRDRPARRGRPGGAVAAPAGGELGVSAPTLYWHVADKRALLDLMAERHRSASTRPRPHPPPSSTGRTGWPSRPAASTARSSPTATPRSSSRATARPRGRRSTPSSTRSGSWWRPGWTRARRWRPCSGWAITCSVPPWRRRPSRLAGPPAPDADLIARTRSCRTCARRGGRASTPREAFESGLPAWSTACGSVDRAGHLSGRCRPTTPPSPPTWSK